MQISGILDQRYLAGSQMSKEQMNTLQDILTAYDPENLSSEDLETLKSRIADTGILRNKTALNLLKEAGFDFRNKVSESEDETVQNDYFNQKTDYWDLYEQFRTGKISEVEFKNALGEVRAGMLFKISS